MSLLLLCVSKDIYASHANAIYLLSCKTDCKYIWENKNKLCALFIFGVAYRINGCQFILCDLTNNIHDLSKNTLNSILTISLFYKNTHYIVYR